MLRYRNRNGLDANLRPLSSRDLYVTRFFFGICNAWFTRVFLIKGLFSIGSVYVSDFKSMYLTRLDKCKYF